MTAAERPGRDLPPAPRPRGRTREPPPSPAAEGAEGPAGGGSAQLQPSFQNIAGCRQTSPGRMHPRLSARPNPETLKDEDLDPKPGLPFPCQGKNTRGHDVASPRGSAPSHRPTAAPLTPPLPVLFQGGGSPSQACAAVGSRHCPEAGSIPCSPARTCTRTRGHRDG